MSKGKRLNGRIKGDREVLSREQALFDTMVERLAALQPPAADIPLISSWLNSERAQSPLAVREAHAIRHRKLKRAMQLDLQLNSAFLATQAIVADFGFSSCNRI